MRPRDKQLLLKNLCARLPYGVKVQYADKYGNTYIGKLLSINVDYVEEVIIHWEDNYTFEEDVAYLLLKEVKPYLRPMSSMTEEEFEYLNKLGVENSLKCIEIEDPKESFSLATKFCVEQLGYLYEHHYDVNGLIPAGLALSTEEFNPYKD